MNAWTGLIQSPAFFDRIRRLAAGAIAASLALCAATHIVLHLGWSAAVPASMALAWGIGFCLTTALRNRDRTAPAVALCLASVWTLVLPFCLRLMESSLGALPASLMAGPFMTPAIISIIVGCCTIPLATLAILSIEKSDGSAGTVIWLSGFAGGLVLAPLMILPLISIRWVACLSGLAASGLLLQERRWPAVRGREAVKTFPLETHEPFWTRGLGALLAGSTMALAGFITLQLFPGNLVNCFFLAGGAVAGLGLGLSRRGRLRPGTHLLLLTCWIGMLAAGYPLWTWFSLELSARISQTWLLLMLRSAFLMILTVPSGWIVGRMLNRQQATRSSLIGFAWPLGFAVAWIAPWSAELATSTLMVSGMALALVIWGMESSFRIPKGAWQRCATAGLVLLAVTGFVFSSRLKPASSEKILFSSAMFQSLRDGVPARQLPWIDEGRELVSFNTLNSHWSAWSYRGNQLVVRHNGVATGMHSTDPETCPHSVSDLLPVLIPLVLHPDPEDVLVLGLHAPTLLTCQAWPLNRVRTLEAELPAQAMQKWLCGDRPGSLLLEGGPLFDFQQLPPELGLLMKDSQSYDIICCPLVHPANTAGMARVTQEFCQRVKGRLKPRGLAAWRLPYYDLGPDVVRQVTASLLNVFDHVWMVESVPGELVFVTSSQPLPPIDEAIVQHLQAPQCRRVLAQAGWDWSVLLGRGGLAPEKVVEFVGGARHQQATSTLLYSLPWEISRWDAKAERTRAVLGEHGAALRTALEDSELSRAISQRLEDLSLAHQIQRENPDEPWAYRKAIKDRLQDRPRSDIIQVKNEGLKRVLHPEDQRRKDYLITLGQAATQEHPPLDAIRAVQEFQTPFDPLLSLFVNYESAQLLARAAEPSRREELQHRLHTVYFSSNQDESVRNVTESISLICGHPECIPDSASRWDQLNSLMQVLAQRWQARFSSTRISKFEPLDTERSVQAATSALAELEELSEEVGLTSGEWKLRQATFEQSLLRPLRQHRSAQLRQTVIRPAAATMAPKKESAPAGQ
jgi:hypothetical protein